MGTALTTTGGAGDPLQGSERGLDWGSPVFGPAGTLPTLGIDIDGQRHAQYDPGRDETGQLDPRCAHRRPARPPTGHGPDPGVNQLAGQPERSDQVDVRDVAGVVAHDVAGVGRVEPERRGGVQPSGRLGRFVGDVIDEEHG